MREARKATARRGIPYVFCELRFFQKLGEIFDLCEVRFEIEAVAVRLAVIRATNEEPLELERFATNTAPFRMKTLRNIALLDEDFHSMLIKLSQNNELRSNLQAINDHVHHVRKADLGVRRSKVQKQYHETARSLLERDSDKATRPVRENLGLTLTRPVDIVEWCYSRIFMAAQFNPKT